MIHVAGVERGLERTLRLVGLIPTTQGSWVLAAVMSLATTARYVLSHDAVVAGIVVPHWAPDGLWLGFLSAALLNATAHSIGKRLSDIDYRRAGQAPATTNETPPGNGET